MWTSSSSTCRIGLQSLVLAALFVADGAHGGSCREASLCCNGRDSACVVQKVPPPGAITTDLNVKPCYCDHACLKLRDCCPDFKSYCGVIDCIVSEWSPWSKCDSACGPGMASRNRTIRQRPQNGGKHCPSLVQKRSCPGPTSRDCRRTRRLLPQLQETALLLPVMPAVLPRKNSAETNGIASGSGWKHLGTGQREELWKDTFHHKRDSFKGYCVAFEVMKVTKQCHKEPNYHALAEGDRVVVRCDLAEPTSPLNVTSSSTSAGASDDDEPTSSAMNNSISSDESSDDDEGADDVGDDDGEADYNESSSRTGSNKVEQRPLLPNRCLGEGLTGRNTRFASLAIPACHGKWLRLTVGVPKKCTPGEAQFIFV